MPDIADRARREKQLARLITRATAKHRARLINALGSPPDVANVPDSLWEEIEAAIEKESATALALLFLAGMGGMATQFDDELEGWRPDEERAGKAASRYAATRSKQLAREMTGTLRDRVKTKADEIRERVDKLRRESEETKRPAPREKLPGESASEFKSRAKEAGEDAPRIGGPRIEKPPEPPTREEIETELEAHVKDVQATQADSAGVTEVTTANTSGEVRYVKELKKRGGIMTATWRTESDASVCQICKPLNWTLEKDWPDAQSEGPPAHPNCRCWVEFHLITAPGDLPETPETHSPAQPLVELSADNRSPDLAGLIESVAAIASRPIIATLHPAPAAKTITRTPIRDEHGTIIRVEESHDNGLKYVQTAERDEHGVIVRVVERLAESSYAPLAEAFDPDQPRDDDGKWVSTGDMSAAMKDPAKAKALRAKVTDPEQRKKLDKKLGGVKPKARKPPTKVRRSAKPTPRPAQKKLSERAARAKASHNPSTKEKQDASEQLEHQVTKALGGTKSGDNLPMDVIAKNGKVGFEVKMLHDAKDQRINMRRDSRERKEAWVKAEKGRKAYIVAVDNRDSFEGGAHKDKYSGHKYYYTDKIGAVSLASMNKANSLAEVRKAIGI